MDSGPVFVRPFVLCFEEHGRRVGVARGSRGAWSAASQQRHSGTRSCATAKPAPSGRGSDPTSTPSVYVQGLCFGQVMFRQEQLPGPLCQRFTSENNLNIIIHTDSLMYSAFNSWNVSFSALGHEIYILSADALIEEALSAHRIGEVIVGPCQYALKSNQCFLNTLTDVCLFAVIFCRCQRSRTRWKASYLRPSLHPVGCTFTLRHVLFLYGSPVWHVLCNLKWHLSSRPWIWRGGSRQWSKSMFCLEIEGCMWNERTQLIKWWQHQTSYCRIFF